MSTANLINRLAVCSWSLRPADPANLIQQLQTIGIPRTQVALDPLREQPELISPLAENRRGDIARLGLKSLLGGTIATWMTASIASAPLGGALNTRSVSIRPDVHPAVGILAVLFVIKYVVIG